MRSYWASLRSASVGPFRRASVPGGRYRGTIAMWPSEWAIAGPFAM